MATHNNVGLKNEALMFWIIAKGIYENVFAFFSGKQVRPAYDRACGEICGVLIWMIQPHLSDMGSSREILLNTETTSASHGRIHVIIIWSCKLQTAVGNSKLPSLCSPSLTSSAISDWFFRFAISFYHKIYLQWPFCKMYFTGRLLEQQNYQCAHRPYPCNNSLKLQTSNSGGEVIDGRDRT